MEEGKRAGERKGERDRDRQTDRQADSAETTNSETLNIINEKRDEEMVWIFRIRKGI